MHIVTRKYDTLIHSLGCGENGSNAESLTLSNSNQKKGKWMQLKSCFSLTLPISIRRHSHERTSLTINYVCISGERLTATVSGTKV